mmetsp:Transcript_12354/g.20110  ORF Transcript_12354/g.20110 Transcript_12354/m.20110 type:complete len:209 (-) Transcript_12354:91-717(-)
MVPPVPTPPKRMSTLPSQSSHISGPVVSRWILGLSGLLNCCSRNPSSPKESVISSALEMAPPMPFAAGVSLTSAPKALRRTRRSIDILSGMVKMSLYPLEAATMASPIPVFPLVGSTRVDLPGEISPRASASSIMLRAMRSLTLLAGLEDSSLAMISAPQSAVTLVILTKGVCPMSSRMLDAILGRPSGMEKSSEMMLLRAPTMAAPC